MNVEKAEADSPVSSNDLPTLECGHTSALTTSIPEVGTFCRQCQPPVPLREWEPTLRSTTERHYNGESSVYTTYLLGLDAHGRAIYYDEFNRSIKTIVPKHHNAFKKDIDGNELPLKFYPPKHGHSRKLINGPNNDVLVSVNTNKTKSHKYDKQGLTKWTIETASKENWARLSDRMLSTIRRSVKLYDKSGRGDSFPVEKGKYLLEKHE